MKKIKIRKSVRWFSEQMELTLQGNDHKGHNGWRYSSNGYLQKRIADELRELQQEKNDYHKIQECIDIANFCMMLADNLEHSILSLPQQRTACGPE